MCPIKHSSSFNSLHFIISIARRWCECVRARNFHLNIDRVEEAWTDSGSGDIVGHGTDAQLNDAAVGITELCKFIKCHLPYLIKIYIFFGVPFLWHRHIVCGWSRSRADLTMLRHTSARQLPKLIFIFVTESLISLSL